MREFGIGKQMREAGVRRMSALNDRPIIGVLAQEVSHQLETIYGVGTYKSFIAASYVKFLEGSGARTVPIWIGKNEEYYKEIMNKINGILLPGGCTWFNQSGGYSDAGEMIMRIAKDLNDNSVYFPVWGTCLGMELFAYLWLDRKYDNFREDCNSHNLASTLEFKEGWESGRMFRLATKDTIDTLSNQQVTYNYHRFCLTEESFKCFGMDKDWRILTSSIDKDDLRYISSIEAIRYPFYGVQFHPEKSGYEWILGKNIPHSLQAVAANRYFGDFFVEECRRNLQSFDSVKEERESLMYNYPLVYTGKENCVYEQCYLFD